MEQTTSSHFSVNGIKIIVTFFVLITLMTTLVFYQEKITTVIRTMAAFTWLFVIPGYCLTKMWNEQNTAERLIISIPVSAAFLGITSYYLALLGLPLSTQASVLPPAIVLFSILVNKIFKDTT